MMSNNRILVRFIVTITTVLRVVRFVFDDLRIQLIIGNVVVCLQYIFYIINNNWFVRVNHNLIGGLNHFVLAHLLILIESNLII